MSKSIYLPLMGRQAVNGIAGRDAALHYMTQHDPAQPQVRLTGTALSEAKVVEMLFSDDPRQRRLALNAINDRLQLFGDVLSGTQTVTLATTNANFPDVKHIGIPTAVEMTDASRQQIDTRWLALFTRNDRRMEAWPGYFKITDLYHAVSVRQYEIGERIQLGFIEGAEAIIEHFLYGTGLQWNQLLMAGRWDRQQGVAAMVTKWANNLAKLGYTTVTASGLDTVSYDTTGSTALEKDINTLNAAMLAVRKSLFEANAPKGGQDVEEIVPPGAPYYLLYNEHTTGYENRITQALAARYSIANDKMSVAEVNRPIIPVASPYVPTGAWYLGLPGRKNVFSLFRDLRFYDFQDARIAGVAEGEVGWGSFRFVRGDKNQWRQVAVS